MRAIRIALAASLLACAHDVPPRPAAPAPRRPTTAAELLAAVDAHYRARPGWSGKFQQRTANAAFGRITRSRGRVMLGHAGQVRFDYDGERAKTFIVAAGTTWALFRDTRTFGSAPHVIGPGDLFGLLGSGQLAARFRPAISLDLPDAAAGAITLALSSRQPDGHEPEVRLEIDPADDHVERVVTTNAQGDQTLIWLRLEPTRADPRWFVVDLAALRASGWTKAP